MPPRESPTNDAQLAFVDEAPLKETVDAFAFRSPPKTKSGSLRDLCIRFRDTDWTQAALRDKLTNKLILSPGRRTIPTMKPQPATIFYSWQSDLPNNTNRGFIQTAIEGALKSLARETSLEAVLDRDTAGVPGSPSISDSIFQKIEEAAVFVADITPIQKHGDRAFPNPNVLFEAGFAAKALGSNRVLLLCNTHFGRIEDLPFDLRGRRIIPYLCAPTDEDKAAGRKSLQDHLRSRIEEVLAAAQPGPGIRVSAAHLVAVDVHRRAGVTPDPPLHVLQIDIQNHGTQPLYLRGMAWSVVLLNKSSMLFTKDMWGLPLSKESTVNPGQSLGFTVRADDLAGIDPEQVHSICVTDQIGRRFEVDQESSQRAIREARQHGTLVTT